MIDNKNIIYETQSKLYNKSLLGKPQRNLYNKVLSEANIRYAIQRISNNSGRNTAGPDGKTYKDISKMLYEDTVELIRCELKEHKVRYVREVEIPKPDGSKRKLGIANITERIAQQCVLNVLEAIVEAQFDTHSYGFRRNVSTKHCVSRLGVTLRVMKGEKWVYDCDLKNYFGTVKIDYVLNKLRTNFKIKDTKFLKLIKELMWLNVVSNGKVIKYNGTGLAQGTILGPVLANVMFDDFERTLRKREGTHTMKSSSAQKSRREDITEVMYYKWKNKSYKGMLNVSMYRYADDFVFLAPNEWELKEAIDLFRNWCKTNELTINENKTRIIHGTEIRLDFLGYHLKVSDDGLIISIKNYNKVKNRIGKTIKSSVKLGHVTEINEVLNGTFYYYDIATNLSDLKRYIEKVLYKLSRRHSGLGKVIWIKGANNYIIKGIDKETIVDISTLRKETATSPKTYIMNLKYWQPSPKVKPDLRTWCDEFIKAKSGYLNTRIAAFVLSKVKAQKKEPVRGIELITMNPKELDIHHKIPRKQGGKDDFTNLVILHREVHVSLHAKRECTLGWNKAYYNKLINMIA